MVGGGTRSVKRLWRCTTGESGECCGLYLLLFRQYLRVMLHHPAGSYIVTQQHELGWGAYNLMTCQRHLSLRLATTLNVREQLTL